MIIAISGKKHSGKSTAAGILEKHLGAGAIRMSIADPIKREVAKIFGPYDVTKKEYLRPVYQVVGQVGKQVYGQTVWLDIMWAEWQKRKQACHTLLIDDVRFPYEAEFLAEHGAHVWRIQAPDTDDSGDDDISETSVDLVKPHAYITNFKNTNFDRDILDEYNRSCSQTFKNRRETFSHESGRALQQDQGRSDNSS